MSTPVTSEKELKDWTYDELCKWASWEVIQGICRGDTLEYSMRCILRIATKWKQERIENGG